MKKISYSRNKLKQSHLDPYRTKTFSDSSEEISDENEMNVAFKECSSCKNCVICCYKILQRYNLLTDAYRIIGLAYKFLLTLSVTQVACERSFSTLKYIKNRLRSTLSQEHLSAFMLMSTEKDILITLNTDVVIDKTSEKSNNLRKLLTY